MGTVNSSLPSCHCNVDLFKYLGSNFPSLHKQTKHRHLLFSKLHSSYLFSHLPVIVPIPWTRGGRVVSGDPRVANSSPLCKMLTIFKIQIQWFVYQGHFSSSYWFFCHSVPSSRKQRLQLTGNLHVSLVIHFNTWWALRQRLRGLRDGAPSGRSRKDVCSNSGAANLGFFGHLRVTQDHPPASLKATH